MTYKRINSLFAAAFLFLVVADCTLNVSAWFYLILFAVYLAINFWGSTFPSSNFFLRAKCKAEKTSNSVAITFDDGPVAEKTEKVLRILKEYQATATFFCIGKNIEALSTVTKKIHQEGHLIGNHSYAHGFLFDCQPAKKMRSELTETNLLIHKTIGQSPLFFRPPYGVTNPLLARALSGMNMTTVGWSVRSFDTAFKKKEKLLGRLSKKVRAGDIILLHDRCDVTIQILPDLLKHIQNIGLRVESLDKLLEERAYE